MPGTFVVHVLVDIDFLGPIALAGYQVFFEHCVFEFHARAKEDLPYRKASEYVSNFPLSG